MFERRLKVILSLLFAVTVVLVGRAAQLQIVQRQHWTAEADDALKHDDSLETMRGSILDCNGTPLAIDVACIDACVDYRAIVDPPEPVWVAKLAAQWSRTRCLDEFHAANAAGRKAIEKRETQDVIDHISAMWTTLATVGHKSPEEMLALRQSIVQRVEARRRYAWYHKYQQALQASQQRHAKGPSPWWRRWLIDDSQDVPQLENFDVNVAEQETAHPILPAISTETQNYLGKAIEDFPGLMLRPGMKREYPRGETVCHITGRLSRVEPNDLKHDPFANDELRKFDEFADLVGRSGLESLAEPLLRGSRGRVSRELSGSATKDDADDHVIDRVESVRGEDVRCTIDVELQQEVLEMFKTADIDFNDKPMAERNLDTHRKVSVHGGAVLIDVATGEVRALVSNPGFDPNTLDHDYATLAVDDINKPLLNRATQYPLETGSTIKPVVGLGAITQGVLGVNEGIECTGYLRIGNRTYRVGRCWTASKFSDNPEAKGSIAHHQIPFLAPHRGHDGNADGFLTFADALERSCNVYFETVASRLGLDGLSYWMDHFGLGRPTGIGIEEWSGKLPDSYVGPNVQQATWSAGIGQGQIAATPIQMANVAATIARDGIWMRPTLVASETSSRLRAIARSVNPPVSEDDVNRHWWSMPDRVDLHLSPIAVKAAHEGMWNVVNHQFSGTGYNLHSDTINIAGKTGTAQAAALIRVIRDEHGKPKLDENGKVVRDELQPSTWQQENPEAPWYLAYDKDGKNIKHSWIIGYAPADHPKVAFAVMVEYGGGGGTTAATIAKGMLESAAQRRYLPRSSVQWTESSGQPAVGSGQ